MENLSDKLSGIEIKIRRLIQENNRLRQANALLKAEVTDCKEVLDGKNEELEQLKTQLEDVTNALHKSELEGVKNTKSIKRQLDKYVQKIDNFIEILEKS